MELQYKFQVSDPLDKVNRLVRKKAANYSNAVGNHFMCSENVSFLNNYLGKELIAGYDQWTDLPFTVEELDCLVHRDKKAAKCYVNPLITERSLLYGKILLFVF